MLTVKNIHQYYGGSHILRDVSFEATLGKVTVLLGRNGVGKTTLLKCLAGLLPARSGSINFDGRDVTKLAPYQRARLGFGYVPQGREIFPRLTVEENLRLGLATAPPETAPVPTVSELFWGFFKITVSGFGGVLAWAQSSSGVLVDQVIGLAGSQRVSLLHQGDALRSQVPGFTDQNGRMCCVTLKP